MTLSTKAHVEFRDVRGKYWQVKRSHCRHYYASRDGKNFTRCKLSSIATVLGVTIGTAFNIILGAD